MTRSSGERLGGKMMSLNSDKVMTLRYCNLIFRNGYNGGVIRIQPYDTEQVAYNAI